MYLNCVKQETGTHYLNLSNNKTVSVFVTTGFATEHYLTTTKEMTQEMDSPKDRMLNYR
jgi:hypothetical protein